MTGVMEIKKVFFSRNGNSAPLTIALVLGLLLVTCAMAEFFRLAVIVQGVRDGLQQAVLSVAVTNYDETYNGLREGYSGGYYLAGETWEESLDYDDVYYYLNQLLGTEKSGGYYVKKQESGYEYRLSGLNVEITNPPLVPGDASENLEVMAQINIEIPLSYGWENLPPLAMRLKTKAAYMPKF